MDNIDGSGSNAKVSDSAYSNSCSNSHSRKSRSSKSTHSGSNSSGSSGYGGKPTSNSSNDQTQTQTEKRPKDKELKKKKSSQPESPPLEPQPEEETVPSDTAAEPLQDGDKTGVASPQTQSIQAQADYVVDGKMDIATSDSSAGKEAVMSIYGSSSRPCMAVATEGFWCVISIEDGVVMYTTSSITTSLGYPRDMWLGRSFIDFMHPRDRSTFASEITSVLAIPKNVKGEERAPGASLPSMFCRIRRYRGLSTGFGVKERVVIFSPFFLKLSFKNMTHDNVETKYLVLQATPFLSHFKVPNEVVEKANPFVLRHSAMGILEFVSPESVPFLGYLPQDLTKKNAFQLYHPEDLPYLNTVYQTIVREGNAPRSSPYRMLSQNGYYVKLESEWTSVINPWSKKLEFVTGTHFTVEGPANPDVFQTPDADKLPEFSEDETKKAEALRNSIISKINTLLTKPAEVAKQQMSKRCQDLATFMETLMAEQTPPEDDLKLDIQDPDNNYYERDSVMLGGISPHHDYNDGESSVETPLSYNQLNYKETLHRYFDSYQGLIENLQQENSEIVPCSLTEPRMSPHFPMLTSADSGEATSSGDSAPAPESSTPAQRLTECLIIKHNLEMEKDLVKKHREPRCSKGEREKAVKESRQKKKEHLARCNAMYFPTSAIAPVLEPEPAATQPHGVKRISGFDSSPVQQKHHCSAARHLHTPPLTPHYAPYIGAPNMWGSPYPMGPYIPGPVHDNMVQPMQMMTPMSAVQYMMVPQPMFSSPLVYAPVSSQASFPVPPALVQQSTLHLMDTLRTVAMTTSTSCVGNIEAVPKEKEAPTKPIPSEESAVERTEDSSSSFYSSSFFKTDSGSAEESTGNKKAAAAKAAAAKAASAKAAKAATAATATVTATTSSTATASATATATTTATATAITITTATTTATATVQTGGYEPYQCKKIQRKNIEPPWMEKVCMTTELIYKYQLSSKNPEEVLLDDRQKILTLEQPPLVNEQLGQLYIDLQLEGVAARLTLEEGLTSSGSSGEETPIRQFTFRKTPRRKREYSKLAMIYEEDAPLPSSPENCQSS